MDRVYRAVNLLGRGLLGALDLGVHWTGAKHLPESGPVVLAATHVSYPDFIFIERAALERGRYVRFMTRHDIWHARWLAPFMDAMQHIPVNREVPAHAYLRARRLLLAGEAVGMFPEAGISYSFTVRPLMRGAASLAQETGAPIVPVAVWGSQRVYSVGVPEPPLSLARHRRVDVSFGAPISVAPHDNLTEVTAALGHKLTGLLEEIQLRPEHRPRPGEVATWYPAHLGGHALTRREAREYDVVPRTAVIPTWGPDPGAYG